MAGRILSGIGWTTASSIIRNVVSVLQISILTRFLTTSDFGVVAIANLFVTFTTLFLDMGISAGIMHRQNITGNEYSSLFWLNIIFGISLTSLLFFLAPVLTRQYYSTDLTNVIKLICFTILFSALGTQQRTYCQKMTYFKRMSIIEIVSSIITFVVALITALKGLGIYSLAYSTLAGSIVLNLSYFFSGIIYDSRIHFHFSLKDVIPFLKLGIYQVGSSILDFFTRELDIIIVSSSLGLEFVGIYNIAKRIPTALYSFLQPIISRVFTPFLAEINNNAYLLKDSYMKMSKTLSWISFPMYFLIAALSPTILDIMFGSDYIIGVPVMIVFCLKYAFNGVNGICGALQVATGRTDIGLKWTIYAVLSTALVYYISAQFGVTTFLFGVSFLIFVNVFVIWLMQFKPMTEVSLKEYLTIYKSSFTTCISLTIPIYLIYNQSSILYAILTTMSFIPLFLIIILNTKDGNFFYTIIQKLPFPQFVKTIIGKFKLITHS